ncbi:Acyl-coenzyme A thioesterase 13 [Choanephora cucurbitarum]|uniref:Acyl-coenzyme A thioesterase 13 n=1 Tax=Choanephora cucurbitarum TaxID=101091 RepID=A0A1C7N0T3_9FUNG|nr:Acyl-coenzyme A thioesterase 13 [Choanephora cucurbitarum]
MKIAKEVAEKYPRLELYTTSFFKKSKDDPVSWDDPIANTLSLVGAGPNKLTWEFVVEQPHCNLLGRVHGGCVATLIDICSSFAIMVNSGRHQWEMLGVSSDLSVTYMSGAAVGQVLRIECETQRVGKNLANIHTKIYDQQNRVCYSGSHTKFNIVPRL